MGQVELENCVMPKMVKIYTLDDIKAITKPIRNNTQFSLKGWSFCSIKNLREFEWMQRAIMDTLNSPESWGCAVNDNYGVLFKLQEFVAGNKCIRLQKWYGLPEKYEYRNMYETNYLINVNNLEEIIPVTARELLTIVSDLIKNRNVEDIYEAYLDFWYHQELTIEHLETLKKLYYQCKLNKPIRYICEKSNEIGGFKDYREDYVDVISNEVTSRYIFDSRRSEPL